MKTISDCFLYDFIFSYFHVNETTNFIKTVVFGTKLLLNEKKYMQLYRMSSYMKVKSYGEAKNFLIFSFKLLNDEYRCPGAYKRGRAPAPSTRAPLRGWRGAPMGEALLILHLLAFPFLRPGTVAYLGGVSGGALPPWKLQN